MSENINVKKLRTSLKISQADFAKLLGVTQKTVSNWEAGKVILSNVPPVSLLNVPGVSE